MVKTYRKKPHEIQAIKFTRDKQKEIVEFCPDIKIRTERHPNGKMSGTFIGMDAVGHIVEGEYLVKSEHGYHKYDGYVFHGMYEEVANAMSCADCDMKHGGKRVVFSHSYGATLCENCLLKRALKINPCQEG